VRPPSRVGRNLLAVFLLSVALMGSRAGDAAEIKLFHPAPFKAVVDALAPQFQKETGHTLATTVGSPAALKRRIDAGEAFDVALLVPDQIDDLIASGKISRATRVNFARIGVGVGTRAGAPKPDISTMEAFKDTLLKAKAVVHVLDGPSAVHFAEMLAQLGIAEEMKSKLRPMPAGSTAEPVARGEAELVVVNMASIVAASGVDLIGPVPADLQAWITFATGVASAAAHAEAGRAFAQYLSTPPAAQ
jgi:molybdate transport system substrate-binding protein